MTGRWPANVILSPEMAGVLDEQSGTLKSGALKPYSQANTGSYSGGMPATRDVERAASEGGASRFFLNAGYEAWELEWIYSVGLSPCGERDEP